MSVSILWALASLAGAAVNDLLFKGYVAGRVGRARIGIYFAAVGAVWAAAILSTAPGAVRELDATTLAYGLLAGTLSVSANLLLLRALETLDATVGATVYRLNFVAVIWLAVLVLRESLTPGKLAGLAAAALAVLLFARGGSKEAARPAAGAVALAVAASLTRAGMGIAYKLALLHGAGRDGFLLVNALCWVAGGLLWGGLSERGLRLEGRTAGYALASGLLVAEIVVALARALETGAASVVVPITQLSFLGTALLAAVFLRERLAGPRLLALACGAAAVLVLSRA